MKNATPVHPRRDQLEAYSLGKTPPEQASEIESHLTACTDCCQVVKNTPGDSFCAQVRAAQVLHSPANEALSATKAHTPAAQTAASSLGDSGKKLAEAEDASPALPPELANHPRYRVRALLGRGGMGAVYKAEHTMMERCVALKTIGRDLDARPDLVERFRREVKAAARLSHPNIVAAYDAEQAGRTHFLVMEYVEGIDLARLVAQRGKLPIEEACEYVRQAALGLQHAHEKGMIHRDIKPHNLMVTPAGQVKILDFGLALFAREAGAESDALTSQGVVMGTADYMAPEQANDSHHADIRADIYSLGCTLYHLLTGRVPFPKGTFLDKVVRHATKKPTPISQLLPELPSELVSVVERMMAKQPEQRYQTPVEVAQALTPFSKGHAPTSVAPDPAAAAFSALMPSQTEIVSLPQAIGRSHGVSGSAVRPRHRRRRSPFVALTLLVLLLGGMIVGGAAIYRIQTDKGQLVITTESDDVKVVISQGGKLIDVIDTKTDKQITLALRSGEYELELKGAAEGLKLNIDKATLTRGKETLAKIERVAKKPPEQVGEIRRFDTGTAGLLRMTLSPDGQRLLAGYEDGSALYWDIGTGKEIYRVWSKGRVHVYGVAFSPDGTKLLTCGSLHELPGGGDAEIRVWEAATGKELKQLKGHTSRVTGVAVSPDGRMVASSGDDCALRLWNLETADLMAKQGGLNEGALCVAFSPDGKLIATGGLDHTVRLWDVKNQKQIRCLQGHTELVNAVAFSRDGSRLLSGDNQNGPSSLKLWEVKTGKLIRTIGDIPGSVHGLAISADGRRALSGGSSGLVQFWDLESGEEICALRGHSPTVVAVAFLPGEQTALSVSSSDRTIRLWRLPDPPRLK